MIVVHAKLKELIPDIEAIKTEKAQLIEIKEWALKKLAD